MKTLVRKRVDLIIAFLVFIVCCLISFTEFGSRFVDEAAISTVIGG